jgi:hypothetical protein
MKRVISVSLGSSSRNHAVETEILGEKFSIERVGVDGDIKKAIAMIRELDGKVDAFGMGGIDLYLQAGNRRYILRDAVPIARAAQKTPIVDGSGLKHTLERKVVRYMANDLKMPLKGMKVLLVVGVDRFGMAETLVEAGADMTFGDMIFALGIPIRLHSLKALATAARLIGPIACNLPFKMLYPTGEKQEMTTPKYADLFHENAMIAGDWHYIRRYMPQNLANKIILTNTVTSKDVDELRQRGARLLVTTTPELNGRSFGTNVMEGVLVALSGKHPSELSPADYMELLERIQFRPRVEPMAVSMTAD